MEWKEGNISIAKELYQRALSIDSTSESAARCLQVETISLILFFFLNPIYAFYLLVGVCVFLNLVGCFPCCACQCSLLVNTAFYLFYNTGLNVILWTNVLLLPANVTLIHCFLAYNQLSCKPKIIVVVWCRITLLRKWLMWTFSVHVIE